MEENAHAHHRWLTIAFLGIAIAVVPQCSPAESADAAATGEAFELPTVDPDVHKLALLVGIGDYPGTAPRDLAGPQNDVELVATLLRDRFGFPAQNICTLVDSQATHAGILRAFRQHLIAHAEPDTEVVFWFSGHGSRILDASGRESGGFDNSRVAYDSRSRSPNGGYDISDDEVHTLLQRLARVTDRIVVVTDACHAEGAVRGGRERKLPSGSRYTTEGKSALDDTLVGPLWLDGPILDDDSPERRPIRDRYVHVGACASWQVAGEWDADGTPFGMLTWFLARALERAEPSTSWREIVESVQLQVQARRISQVPTFDGNVDRAVFGGQFKAPPRGHPARLAGFAGAEHDLVVEAGFLHGVSVGSGLEVSIPYAEKPVGKARVERLQSDGLRAFANWDGGGPADLPIDQPLRALEVTRSEQAPRLAVTCPREGFIDALGLAEWWREVPADQAHYVVTPSEGEVGFELATIEGVRVWPDDGKRVPESPTAEIVARNALLFRCLEDLPMERGHYQLKAAIRNPTSDQAEKLGLPAAEVRVLGAVDGSVVAVDVDPDHAKELVMLEITNTSEVELRVAVVSLEESGHDRIPLFGVGSDLNLLRPGASTSVPVAINRLSNWPLDRPMRDRYVVIGTRDELNLGKLTSWRDQQLRSASKPLPWVLARAFTPNVTRSGGSQSVTGPRNWAITWVDLHTR